MDDKHMYDRSTRVLVNLKYHWRLLIEQRDTSEILLSECFSENIAVYVFRKLRFPKHFSHLLLLSPVNVYFILSK